MIDLRRTHVHTRSKIMAVTDPDFNPSGDDRVKRIKEAANALAELIETEVTPGRRRSVALTRLEEASMWAVKAAVCGDD